MSSTKDAIKTIYDEREKFIILGLTGRTGAGCTEISKILETETFEGLNLPMPQTHDFTSNEERKYEIIYSYAKEHWKPFYRISMTDIILSFLVSYDYKKLWEIVKYVFREDKKMSSELFRECEKIKSFQALYEDICKSYMQCYNEQSNRLVRENSAYCIECNMLNNISKLQNEIRDIFAKRKYTYKLRDNHGKYILDKTTGKNKFARKPNQNRIDSSMKVVIIKLYH